MQADNAQIALQGQERREPPAFRVGTVRKAVSGKGVLINWGGSEDDGKYYMYLSSYEPQAGDRVIAARYKGSCYILGKLVK